LRGGGGGGGGGENKGALAVGNRAGKVRGGSLVTVSWIGRRKRLDMFPLLVLTGGKKNTGGEKRKPATSRSSMNVTAPRGKIARAGRETFPKDFSGTRFFQKSRGYRGEPRCDRGHGERGLSGSRVRQSREGINFRGELGKRKTEGPHKIEDSVIKGTPYGWGLR